MHSHKEWRNLRLTTSELESDESQVICSAFPQGSAVNRSLGRLRPLQGFAYGIAGPARGLLRNGSMPSGFFPTRARLISPRVVSARCECRPPAEMPPMRKHHSVLLSADDLLRGARVFIVSFACLGRAECCRSSDASRDRPRGGTRICQTHASTCFNSVEHSHRRCKLICKTLETGAFGITRN
jgi:hypothetical protein